MIKLKIIHFDTHPSAEPYKRKGDIYITENVNTYIINNGSFEADAVTGFTCSKFTKEIIDQIKGLRLIVTRSIGYDNIDQDYCRQKGIKFSNVDYSRYNVAHHTWALILHAVRSLEECFSSTRSGNFCDEEIYCHDLREMILGIIGFGRIGYEVFKIAKSFGVKVIAYDTIPKKEHMRLDSQYFEYKDMEYVLKNSDILSLHCDANPTSIGMIDDKAIKQMKNNVILINTARGSIINESDLIKNINKFAYIGLDVIVDENDFNKSNPLLKYPNIFITPHIAHKSPVTVKERWLNTYSIIGNFFKNQNGTSN